MSFIKAICFDLDGTLVDTEGAAIASILKAYSDWEINLPIQAAQQIAGKKWEALWPTLFQDYPPPVSTKEAKSVIFSLYRRSLEHALPSIPGAAAFVTALHMAGFPLALVSGSYQHDVMHSLEALQIRSCFQTVFAAENYAESKPSPLGYQLAMDVLGAKGHEVLIFEDSTPGLQSAKRAGARTVAVTATKHVEVDLSLADLHINDYRGLGPFWVRSLFSH